MIHHIISRSPVLVLLAGAVIISFSGVLVKLSGVAPSVSAFYRVFFGSIFLIGACLVQKEFKTPPPAKNLLAAVCGLLFALDLFFWHLCIQYTGPGLATILGNFQVFVLAMAGFLVFKEKITLKFILAVPLAVFGLFMVIGIDIDVISRDYLFGIGFGLITALFYSGFLLLLRKIQSDSADVSLFFYMMVVSVSCSVFLGLKIWVSGESFAIPGAGSLFSLLTLGIGIQGIVWVFISNAMPKVRASHAGLILLLQPALSFVWDFLIFDRPTGVAGWIGVAVVLYAIYMGMTGQPNKRRSE